MFKLLSKRKKPELQLGIDIGTEAVKAVVFKKEAKELKILGHSLEYFDKYGAFDSKDFELSLTKKTVLEVIKTLKKIAPIEGKETTLLLPPTVFKARVVNFNFERENPKEAIKEREREKLIHQMVKNSKKEIASQIGILPKDLYFKGGDILERKIDGYQVPSLLNFKGKKVEIKVLITLLLKDYFDNIKAIKDLLGKVKIIHESQGLSSYLKRFDSNGLFLDVGGEVTQFFLVKEKIEKINDFRGGARDFSEILSEELGLSENRARILKERYARGELREATKAIEKFFKKRAQLWLNDLKEKLAVFEKSITSSEIYLFGGGSNLSEIQASLGEVKLLNPQHFNINQQELGIEYTPLVLCLKEF